MGQTLISWLGKTDLRPVTESEQVQFLRVLQEGEVTRVGVTAPTPLDVRIIAATNRTLSDEVAAGRFREDLFYRPAAAVIRLPPLREREGDAALLPCYKTVYAGFAPCRSGAMRQSNITSGSHAPA
jgi:transcriptional regulator of acetoin/glycerol metabolism